MKNVIAILLCVLAVSCRMHSVSSELEETLSQAGSNRGELFRVLTHYEEEGDSLKLRAAQFLLENMAWKAYATGRVVEEYFAFMDSVFRTGHKSEEELPLIYGQYERQARYLKEKPVIALDARTLTADYLIRNIDEAFAVWHRPWNRHLSFDEFCEWILPYRISGEVPEEWRTLYRERFEPLLQSDTIRTARQACTVINNELMKYSICIPERSVLPVTLPSRLLMNIKFGLCGDYANLAVFAMRSAGIPVGIETVPYWGRGNGRHTFNVVYDNDSTFHDFSGAEQNPDEHLIRFRHEMPKVYRRTFGKQPSSLAMQRGTEDVPDFFKNPCLEDVTGNYPFIEARDITVPVGRHSDRKFAYLCVYHPEEWIPVAWGRRQGDSVRFQNVCPNIVYHPALYADGKLQLTGHPFLLDTLGHVNVLAPQASTRTCTIGTVYKDAPKLIKLLPSFIGGKIQGANRPDFSDAVTYYTFTENPTFKYTTVHCGNTKPCKYLRYLPSGQSKGDMADLEFYAEGSDVPLKGKVTGQYKPSPTYSGSGAEAMFDDNPLTFFHTADTQGWGGLELEKPVAVSRIRFIIRSENNGIRKGNEYELFYMNCDLWVSLGRKVATEDDRLEYRNIPKNALLKWVDHTKDISKRIFVIENNKEIWY